MDGWVRVLRPFNNISVISRRWKGEHERLCAMKCRLGSGRISPPAGFEPVTPWSEVGSANRSATQMLLGIIESTRLVMRCTVHAALCPFCCTLRLMFKYLSGLVFWLDVDLHMSHIIRKPVYAICEQQRCRSACTSVPLLFAVWIIWYLFLL